MKQVNTAIKCFVIIILLLSGPARSFSQRIEVDAAGLHINGKLIPDTASVTTLTAALGIAPREHVQPDLNKSVRLSFYTWDSLGICIWNIKKFNRLNMMVRFSGFGTEKADARHAFIATLKPFQGSLTINGVPVDSLSSPYQFRKIPDLPGTEINIRYSFNNRRTRNHDLIIAPMYLQTGLTKGLLEFVHFSFAR